MRKEYTQAGLHRKDLKQNPFEQFDTWFQQALDAKLLEPNAFDLATVSEDLQPRNRVVLLKYYDKEGFVFFTNYESRKGRDMEFNPKVAMLFPWLDLERQVKIEGTVKKLDKKDSLKYFLSRPKGSQLGAWVSKQSSVISTRKLLEQKMQEVKQRFKEGKVPIPDFWGGYKIIPTRFEFWQGRQNRLHDRFEYSLDANGWKIERLSP
jgi:pyridoxamine 5'-phosphate oxidase